jgi:hypothetical protein
MLQYLQFVNYFIKELLVLIGGWWPGYFIHANSGISPPPGPCGFSIVLKTQQKFFVTFSSNRMNRSIHMRGSAEMMLVFLYPERAKAPDHTI